MPEISVIYGGHDVCEQLGEGEWCFRVKRYQDGGHVSLVHQHIPRNRMSQDRALEVHRALIPTLDNWTAEWVISSNQNGRVGGSERYPGFQFSLSHPCKGVVRKYISSGNTTAWIDTFVGNSGETPEA